MEKNEERQEILRWLGETEQDRAWREFNALITAYFKDYAKEIFKPSPLFEYLRKRE